MSGISTNLHKVHSYRCSPTNVKLYSLIEVHSLQRRPSTAALNWPVLNCDSKRDFLRSLSSLISESRHKEMHHTLARVTLVIPAIPRAFRYQLSATQQKTPTQTRLTSLPAAIANPAKDLFPVPWSHFNAYLLNWRRTKRKRRKTCPNAANY